MKKCILFTLAVLALAACRYEWPMVVGSGVEVTETTTLTDFTKIAVYDDFTVNIVPGNAASATITADDNIIDYIGITRQAETLKFFLQNGVSYTGLSILQVELTVPELRSITLYDTSQATIDGFVSDERFELLLHGGGHANFTDVSAGDIKIRAGSSSEVNFDGVKGADVEIDLSTSSKIYGSLTASGSVAIDMSSSSEVNIEGTGGILDIKTTGSSQADLAGFTVTDVFAEARNSSRIKVNMNGTLHCELVDDSILDYTGKAIMGELSVSASSRLREF